ncbi:MAG TPA: ester cyclase [Pyrinomonadaceae bacterium]|nr:ester cyclase [Pyrinomonadaceae bacterium]
MADYPKRQKNEDEVRHANLLTTRRLLAAFSWVQPEVFPKLISRDIVNRSPHPAGAIREEDEVRLQHTAYPDLHYREEVAIAEGDMVFLGWEGTGTHLGPLYGKEATGVRVELHGGEILRYSDGLVVEHFDHFTKPRLESLALMDVLDDPVLNRLVEEGLL